MSIGIRRFEDFGDATRIQAATHDELHHAYAIVSSAGKSIPRKQADAFRRVIRAELQRRGLPIS